MRARDEGEGWGRGGVEARKEHRLRSQDGGSHSCRRHVECMGGTTPTGSVPSRGFRDLIVWQRANRMALACDKLAGSLWKTRRRTVGEQLLSAAVSVSSNIAEGHGRTSHADNARHLAIARGSVREVESLLEFLTSVAAVPEFELEGAMGYADEVARMLTVMIRKHGTRNLSARDEGEG